MDFASFTQVRRLGVGGNSEVFVGRSATAPAPADQVVIKRLRPEFASNATSRARFAREAELHSRVRHPNIVGFIGSGEDQDGCPFLILEYVDGLDGQRLLTRLRARQRPVPIGVAVYLTCELLDAVACVHAATDAAGEPLGVVHRDITPSNIYLSRQGRLKLGDFGIAELRHASRASPSTELRGKASYLAPEQISHESFDQRSDLFSVAAVLTEMLIGEPLFSGGSKLAVLLAIRDGHLDALVEQRSALPPKLYAILLRALARDPEERFVDASALASALRPFADTTENGARGAALLVEDALTDRSGESSPCGVADRVDHDEPPWDAISEPATSERITREYTRQASFVTTTAGEQRGPWGFAQLAMALATGVVGGGDMIAYAGAAPAHARDIPELARFLPLATPTTHNITIPTGPLASYPIASGAIAKPLLDIFAGHQTCMLFCATPAEATIPKRKELYFLNGRLVHVASSDASELLGEYLVRRRRLSRDELNLALAVLDHHDGRLGDTLIALGLVPTVEVFQAIRDQGRARVADLFTWNDGTAQLFLGQEASHISFPLDLDVGALLVAGLEAQLSGQAAIERYRPRLGSLVGPATPTRRGLSSVSWPPVIAALLALTRTPARLSEVLAGATFGGASTTGAVLRALEILLQAELVAFV